MYALWCHIVTIKYTNVKQHEANLQGQFRFLSCYTRILKIRAYLPGPPAVGDAVL